MDLEHDVTLGARSTLSISQLYDEVTEVLDVAFPRNRPVWIRGEVQKVSESSGHAYIDLVDAEDAGTRGAPVLKVKCWRSTWGPLKASLAADGASLAAGMSVVIRGRVDFYKVRAEVGFILDEIDVRSLLGRLAQERAALIATLDAQGLLEANRAIPLPGVALRVGLVGSPGTEGFSDFLGQLERSGLGFEVIVARSAVQGAQAPVEVARALLALATAEVDLICVVRGGGSRGDLAAFDSEQIARAIATSTVPVWTGIGHTGDESVADLVAHTRHITPTACGQAVASRALLFWQDVVDSAERIASQSRRTVAEMSRDLDSVRRRLVVGPSSALTRAHASLANRSARLSPSALAVLERESRSLASHRRLLAAFDPSRLLERGWTMTTDAAGQVIRSVAEVAQGATIVTTLRDGTIMSTVAETTMQEG
ncbi:MAG: exodeoxyribonuclease VII large subunit [Actinomycetes bacterium]